MMIYLKRQFQKNSTINSDLEEITADFKDMPEF